MMSDCPDCEGTGEVSFDRCPASMTRGLGAFTSAYFSQVAGDGWPSEGPRNRQAAWYVRAKEIADAERASVREARERALGKLYGQS